MTNFLLLLNFAATLYMTGLIWFVQIVHYYLFDKVGRDGYAVYAALHAQRTAWVAGPPMVLELATAGLLAVHPPPHIPAWAAWLGFGLIGVLWLSTLLLQIPQHNTLGSGFDPAAHRFLVRSNWLRTACWSLRALLVFWMMAQSGIAGNGFPR